MKQYSGNFLDARKSVIFVFLPDLEINTIPCILFKPVISFCPSQALWGKWTTILFMSVSQMKKTVRGRIRCSAQASELFLYWVSNSVFWLPCGYLSTIVTQHWLLRFVIYLMSDVPKNDGGSGNICTLEWSEDSTIASSHLGKIFTLFPEALMAR